MSTSPQIGQLIAMPDGVAIARASMQNIVIVPNPGGSGKFINVRDGNHLVTFKLDQSQCAHLAQLLLDGLQPGGDVQ